MKKEEQVTSEFTMGKVFEMPRMDMPNDPSLQVISEHRSKEPMKIKN
jgi:hypothetical protein